MVEVESVAAFKVYRLEEIENMTNKELAKEIRSWQDFESMAVAIGTPSVLEGMILEIADLRRENADLRGKKRLPFMAGRFGP